MGRIRLLIQYNGEAFCGWQRQDGLKRGRTSVQEALEGALCEVLGWPPTEAARVRMMAAGRTDSGVHARAMAVHFDCPVPMPAERMPVAINRFLPESVSVLRAEAAPDSFDARRDGRLRWYRYQARLIEHREPLGPRAWQIWKPVNLDLIRAALPLLEGEHDFAGFRSANCQARRTVLRMRQARLTARGDLLAFDFKCRSFLHHQVRFMVGSLAAVGRGQLTLEGLVKIRDEFDRPKLAVCAPPGGLCLMGIGYTPEECEALLAENPEPPSF